MDDMVDVPGCAAEAMSSWLFGSSSVTGDVTAAASGDTHHEAHPGSCSVPLSTQSWHELDWKPLARHVVPYTLVNP